MPAPRKREWGTSSVIEVFSRKKRDYWKFHILSMDLEKEEWEFIFGQPKVRDRSVIKMLLTQQKKAVAIILYPLWFRSLGCYTR